MKKLYNHVSTCKTVWLDMQNQNGSNINEETSCNQSCFTQKIYTVYTHVQVERVYKSNPIFEAKNTTFLEKV